MAREAPEVVERLPEQYFGRILAAAAAARTAPGAPFIDLGRGNPDLPPPGHAIEALRDAAGWARLSLATADADLDEAVRRISRLLAG